MAPTQEMLVTMLTRDRGRRIRVMVNEDGMSLWLDDQGVVLTQKEVNYLSDVFSGLFDSEAL